MALVVGEKLATLCELDEYYSYEDALDLAEVVMVRNNNEMAAMKESQKK